MGVGGAGHENAKKRKLKQTAKNRWKRRMVKLVLRPTAATTHGVIENTHITAQTLTHIHIYSYNCTHTDKRRGNWQYLRNYISCGRRHTTTGKICNVDWLHLFLLLLHIGTDQSTPFRAPVHTSAYPTTPSPPATEPRASSQSQSQSQCFLCRSEWQLHFICSINLSQLDLSRDTFIHTSISKYEKQSSSVRQAGFMIWQKKVQSMVEELCRQLKLYRGECVFKRSFNGVSYCILHVFMSQLCKFNTMCHGTSSNVDSTYI